MTQKQYQTGIQDIVYKIIEESKKKGLPYITKSDIISNIQNTSFNLKDPENQVGQALNHLKTDTKYRRAKIKKYYNERGSMKGWTTNEEEITL